jgi:hypothetical protein
LSTPLMDDDSVDGLSMMIMDDGFR